MNTSDYMTLNYYTSDKNVLPLYTIVQYIPCQSWGFDKFGEAMYWTENDEELNSLSEANIKTRMQT